MRYRKGKAERTFRIQFMVNYHTVGKNIAAIPARSTFTALV